MSTTQSAGMVPEASAREAYDALKSDPSARLVDVRTRAEWTYVGLPDLGEAHAPLLLEWQTFPSSQVNEGFVDQLQSACPDKTSALYFICRSGARSLAAARAMGERGYDRVINVKDGFEGPPDEDGHRGNVAGWKADGLPWRQN